jgi:hypothetical protein
MAPERPAFTIDDETYTWGDVMMSERLRDHWDDLERITRHGLACVRRLTASGEELDAGEQAAAEASFRYARNLISGEDVQNWLERWGLRVGEWRAFVRRAILRERWSGELDATAARFPATDEEVAAAIWTEAVCSGALEAGARRLAGELALGAETGEASGNISTRALEREIAAQGLDWLRIEGELLELSTEDLAREAALCVREDGRPLAEVAAECGTEPRPLNVFVVDVESEVAPILLAAREGELVGPVARDGVFKLFFVRKKTPASSDDPAIRRKAQERVRSRELERAVAAKVRWHEHL